MIDAALDGAEIFVNVSGSEIERGKLRRKLQMMEEFTERHGGAYAYVNLKGCIGQRNYFDGCCFFTENGKAKELSEPFNLSDVQVTPITISINSIRTFRINNKSFQK
jgi:NAD+ synthase (glutamine-hydrolysing)